MKKRKPVFRNAGAQMSDALARWERDGGAPARAARRYSDDAPDTTVAEAVFSDVAIQQGMILERRDDEAYRLYG